MKKLVAISLSIVIVLLALTAPADAWTRRHGHVHSRVFVGFGPAFYWGPSPYWYYPPPYYVYEPPPVVVEQPRVYVERPSEPEQGYWHYCASGRGYYPTVQSCPEAWLKVAPRAE